MSLTQHRLGAVGLARPSSRAPAALARRRPRSRGARGVEGDAAARVRGRGAGAEAALGDVASGRAFLLQAGECAESFRDFSAVSIREKLKIFLQMSVVMIFGSGLPLVKVGRIAGQFAKPRSQPTERVGDVELPSFFGHMVNDDAPTLEARTPDPSRLLRVYHQSAATLNLAARVHERRLRRPDAGAHVEPGVRRELARGTALRGARRRDRARARLRPRVRHRRRRRRGGCTASTSGRATRASCSTTRRR